MKKGRWQTENTRQSKPKMPAGMPGSPFKNSVAAGILRILPAVEPGHPPSAVRRRIWSCQESCRLSLAPSTEERTVRRRRVLPGESGLEVREYATDVARWVRAARCRPLRQPGWPPLRLEPFYWTSDGRERRSTDAEVNCEFARAGKHPDEALTPLERRGPGPPEAIAGSVLNQPESRVPFGCCARPIRNLSGSQTRIRAGCLFVAVQADPHDLDQGLGRVRFGQEVDFLLEQKIVAHHIRAVTAGENDF